LAQHFKDLSGLKICQIAAKKSAHVYISYINHDEEKITPAATSYAERTDLFGMISDGNGIGCLYECPD